MKARPKMRSLYLTSAVAMVSVAVLAGCSATSTSTGSTSTTSTKATGVVNLNTEGGDVVPVWQKAWWTPFTKKTGLKVNVSQPNDFNLLEAAVKSGNVEWNVEEVSSGGQFLQAAKEGILQKIDKAKLKKYFVSYGGKWSDIIPASVSKYGVWITPYSTMLIYDKRVFPKNGPTSVKDLWNVKKYPGKRCIAAGANDSLEMAAYASGVAKDDMYPLSVDKAIKKIAEIKPYIAKYWSNGSEPVQLVTSGQCVMSTAYNGRPFIAKTQENNNDLGIAFDGAIIHTGYWTIPKGAPDPDAGYRALAYYMLPQVGAASANLSGYANGNSASTALIDDAAKPYVATSPANLKVGILQSDAWYYKYGVAAQEKYTASQLK